MSTDNATHCFLCRGIVFSIFSSGIKFDVYKDHLVKEHKVGFNFNWIIQKSIEGGNSNDEDDTYVVDWDGSKNDSFDEHKIDTEDEFDSLFDSLEDSSDDDMDENNGDSVTSSENSSIEENLDKFEESTESGKLSTKTTEMNSIACHLCNKIFKRSFHLKLHLERGHKKKESFQCEFCGKSLSSKHGFEKHLSGHKHNNKEPTHSCKTCTKLFSTDAALKHHMKNHTKPYKCNNCGKGFAQEKSAKNHINSCLQKSEFQGKIKTASLVSEENGNDKKSNKSKKLASSNTNLVENVSEKNNEVGEQIDNSGFESSLNPVQEDLSA